MTKFFDILNDYVIIDTYMDPTQKSPISSNNPSETNPGGIRLPSNEKGYSTAPSTQSQNIQTGFNIPSSQSISNNPVVPNNPSSPNTNTPSNNPPSQNTNYNEMLPLMRTNANYIMPQSVPAGMSPNGAIPGNNKTKKIGVWNVWLIVLVAIVLCLSIVLIIWLALSGSNDGGESFSDTTNSFNSYINYVVYGQENNGAINIDDVAGAQPYFESVSGDDLEQYLLKAKEKYTVFSNLYSNGDGNVLGIESMDIYFYDYAKNHTISMGSYLDLYEKNGVEGIDNFIKERFPESSSDVIYNSYIDDEKQFANLCAKIFTTAESAGCRGEDGAFTEGCYNMSEQESENLSSVMGKIDNDENILYDNAVSAILALYEELYGVNSEEGA